jgi:membrane AbrB-like protein
MRDFAAQVVQIAVGCAGGVAFDVAGFPAPWLSGSMLAVVALALAGYARPMPRLLVDAALLTSGAAMGAAITPEAFAALAKYPLSLVILAASITVSSLASTAWLMRMSGWRRDDALLASLPGGMSAVLAIAADRKAAVTSIAIAQALRVLVVIALVPSFVVLAGGMDAGVPAGRGQAVADPGAMAAVLVGGLVLGTVLEGLGVAAPLMLGAMVASTALHASDVAPGAIPPLVATAGMVLIGVFIGERFRTLPITSLRKIVPAALASFAVGMAVATLFALLAARIAGVGVADALVAFAPGGVEAMALLAVALGLDPLYVTIHHFARFFGISLAAPFLLGRAPPAA